MSDEILAQTQQMLSTIVTRTPLTAKLLGKPPFRFLHDLTMEIVHSTGFAQGLYSEEESQSSNVTEKEAKIAFLQKLIQCVELSTGEHINAKPAKIVAGLDPEDTNRLLQVLATAAINRVDATSAIESITGKRPIVANNATAEPSVPDMEATAVAKEPPIAEPSKEAKPAASVPEQRPAATKPATTTTKTTSRSREKLASQSGSQSALNATPASNKAIGARSPSKEKLGGEPAKPLKAVKPLESKQKSLETLNESLRNKTEAVTPAVSSRVEMMTPKIAMERTAVPTPAADTSNNNEDIVVRPARPMTARRAPPKVKLAENEVAADAVKEAPQVFLERSAAHEETEEDFVEITSPEVAPLAEEAFPPVSLQTLNANNQDQDHGALVRKILETNKELAGGDDMQSPTSAAVDPNEPVSKAKEKALLKKELQALRESIQQVCRSTAPLGTTLDYFKEDLDSMDKEIAMWKAEAKKVKQQLDEEIRFVHADTKVFDYSIRTTKKVTAPLDQQLQAVEAQLIEKLEKIDEAQARVCHNEQTIARLLQSVVGSAVLVGI